MEQKKLSEMSEPELRHEIQLYKEKMRKAEMNGILNEYDVYQSKSNCCRKLLSRQKKIEIGKIYKLTDGSNQYFKVERLKGILRGGLDLIAMNPKKAYL